MSIVAPKKPYIELNLQVILTNIGVNFFKRQGHKLKKFITAEGNVKYGIKFNKVTPNAFQHMLRIGYIARLEITRPEFSTVRSDMVDFSKLIVFGFFYRQFDQILFDLLIQSSVIKAWNRRNRADIIDENTQIKSATMKEFLEKNKDEIKAIRNAIKTPLINGITRNTNLQADEKSVMFFLADQFMDYTRPLVWFILVHFSASEERRELIRLVQKHLDLYLQRSRIADYLALLLAELTISAEVLNINSFVERTYGEGTDAQAVIFDQSRRSTILNRMAKEGADFTVAWSFGVDNFSSIGFHKHLAITVYNREAEYFELKEKVNASMKSGSGVSLDQFYEKPSVGRTEMGLLYLGSLQDECDKVGMRFTSRVGHARRSGIPSITLTIFS